MRVRFVPNTPEIYYHDPEMPSLKQWQDLSTQKKAGVVAAGVGITGSALLVLLVSGAIIYAGTAMVSGWSAGRSGRS